jgi:predicted amidohydrolase
MNRLRVAAIQYLVRPVKTMETFRGQVSALVEAAADYKCGLIVFPEYFSIQLLTMGDTRRPISEQIRDLAKHAPEIVALLSELAKAHGVYIVGGTTPVADADGVVRNACHIVGPTGDVVVQEKLHMTRFEREDWNVAAGRELAIVETAFGSLAVAICYDVEFPEVARAAARQGARILVVPSCTDDRQGFLRVRYCAHARAIENQMYVIQASTVGSLPDVPAVSLNYGQASILTPSDFQFSRDGILAEGNMNQEMMVIGDLDLTSILESRERGTVLPLADSDRTAALVQHVCRYSL